MSASNIGKTKSVSIYGLGALFVIVKVSSVYQMLYWSSWGYNIDQKNPSSLKYIILCLVGEGLQ